MKFCSITLGCKVNQYETQAMEEILLSRGHTLAIPGAGCDVCIINTCAVTSESSRKSGQAVRRMKKSEPDALIAVCGCLSQIDSGLADQLNADIVGGSGNRHRFVNEIEKLYLKKMSGSYDAILPGNGSETREDRDSAMEQRLTGGQNDSELRCLPLDTIFEELPPGSAAGRTRALLKIQDGCDNYCAYCVIPYARGRARSLPESRAVEFAGRLEQQGYREIVITGIEIASYGKDISATSSLERVIQMIAETAKSARIRLSSLDPGFVTGEFCDAMSAIPNLCNHFHLSLQSGCDDTLLRMGRKYDAKAAGEAISMLRRQFINCGITSDLITGFPGETDSDFERTMEFITEAEFSGMHIFPFSPRPGTRAAEMPGQVPKSVRSERAYRASRKAKEMADAFKHKQVGKKAGVLFERERAGALFGHTENYVEVAVAANGRGGGQMASGVRRNTVHSVQISGVINGIVWAEII